MRVQGVTVVVLALALAGCAGQSGAIRQPATSATAGTVGAGAGAHAPTLESQPPGTPSPTPTATGGLNTSGISGASRGSGSAHGVMPDLRGQTLAEANHVLGDNVTIVWRDASAKDRVILAPSHWVVCTQKPAPGASYRGVHVMLTAVKTGEHC